MPATPEHTVASPVILPGAAGGEVMVNVFDDVELLQPASAFAVNVMVTLPAAMSAPLGV